MTVTANAFLVANCLRHRLSDGDADVFHRVVRVNMQVTLGLNLDVDQTVARDLIHHVIEKGYAGLERRFATAVQVDLDADLRLVGIAGDFGGAHGGVVGQQ